MVLFPLIRDNLPADPTFVSFLHYNRIVICH